MTMQLGRSVTTNDTYGHYTDRGASHLPEAPRTLKNRYLDNERDRLARSNDAYGKFWADNPRTTSVDSSGGDSERPAGLASNNVRHDEPTTKRLQHKIRQSADYDSPWNGAGHPLIGPAGSSSGYVDRPEYPWNAGERETGGINAYPEENDWSNGTNVSRLKPLPPIGVSSLSSHLPTYRSLSSMVPGNDETSIAGDRQRGLGELEKFVRQYQVTVGLNGGRGDDIRNIDLHLRLQDNTTVTIRSVPFSIE